VVHTFEQMTIMLSSASTSAVSTHADSAGAQGSSKKAIMFYAHARDEGAVSEMRIPTPADGTCAN
jgi:hypothetical protein